MVQQWFSRHPANHHSTLISVSGRDADDGFLATEDGTSPGLRPGDALRAQKGRWLEGGWLAGFPPSPFTFQE